MIIEKGGVFLSDQAGRGTTMAASIEETNVTPHEETKQHLAHETPSYCTEMREWKTKTKAHASNRPKKHVLNTTAAAPSTVLKSFPCSTSNQNPNGVPLELSTIGAPRKMGCGEALHRVLSFFNRTVAPNEWENTFRDTPPARHR